MNRSQITLVVKPFYYVGTAFSMLIGIWHFSVPYAFQWYSYIPDAPASIIVGIDWINFFFSLFLTGLSLMMIMFGKRVFSGSKDVLVFYGFLVFVWFCRFTITFIVPWPLEPNKWVAYGQQIAASMIFIFLLIPLLLLVFTNKRNYNK